MFNRKYWLTALVCLITSLIAVPVQAGHQVFGNYIVYFNALNTDMLEPQIARQYKIKRSKNRAMFNIAVQRRVPGRLGQPITAKITGHATNLNAQTKQMTPREIKEGPAIYYIGDFSISDRETLDFEFQIIPEGEQKPFTLRFRQPFFVH